MHIMRVLFANQNCANISEQLCRSRSWVADVESKTASTPRTTLFFISNESQNQWLFYYSFKIFLGFSHHYHLVAFLQNIFLSIGTVSESSCSCWHLRRCWFPADTPQNAEHIHRAYIHFLLFLHLFRSLSTIRLFSPAYVSCETLKMQPFLFLFLCACAKREVIVPGGPSGDCGNWG